MLDSLGFDRWADQYDDAVRASDRADAYPFAGYGSVLDEICRRILTRPGASVLDLGFGTGTLTARLYAGGCEIFGQDHSRRMLEIASAKMPLAHLYQGDFSRELAEPLRQRKYDFIVATYALHHLTDPQKVALLTSLRELLEPGGAILVGDISFPTRADLERCRREAGDEWDEEEIYLVAEELRAAVPSADYLPLSRCGGVLTLLR